MDASIAPNNPSSHADSVGTGNSARTATSTVAVACSWFASAALVAVTVQVPTAVPVSVLPFTVQNALPAVTA